MTDKQRLVILADAVLLGIFAVGAGFVLDVGRLVLGGSVLVVASGLYGWATRRG